MLGYDAVPRQRRRSLSNPDQNFRPFRSSSQQRSVKYNMRYIYASGGLAFLTICFYLNFIHQSKFDGLSYLGEKLKSGTSMQVPFTPPTSNMSAYGDSYWLANIKHQGNAAFNPDFQGYKVFRNVMDFGAKGDGVTDDTAAINAAISSQPRCGQGCGSSTTQPALVYFPPGTYLVSSPIIAWYYTQLVGSPTNLPVLKAAPTFQGIAVVDSDPYIAGGDNWYQNQNNFFRVVRNFVIDLTSMGPASGTGIHWQVAQATSLYNIRFEMSTAPGNNHQGIFMDNGSGGWMNSLTFNGGKFGAFFGNQQFTTTNLTFNNCQTAIYMNWNWVWLLKGININNCGVGIDMSGGAPNDLAVGSVVLLDSIITNTPKGIVTGKSASSQPSSAGTLVIDNLKVTNVPFIVTNPAGDFLLVPGVTGTTTIKLWGQGPSYSRANPNGGDFNVVSAQGQTLDKPTTLLDSSGNFLERSRPQYEDIPATRFISVKDHGAVGDGVTDDTVALQTILTQYSNQVIPEQKVIIFFDHGVYRVTSTLHIYANTFITGECWSTIMSSGPAFADSTNPQPVVQVGVSGDKGLVEISDMIIQTQGPAGGAILMEWNMHDSRDQPQGIVGGMWDVHFRVGGTAGTNLQSDQHTKTPDQTNTPSVSDTSSQSAFMLLYITKTASLYLENSWAWTSDHELDLADHNQITIYSGRGIYCEASMGPVWMYGTGSEHNQMYQYQFYDAHNVFIGISQTETPYYQSNPPALLPFPHQPKWNDPDFSRSSDKLAQKAWGLRILESSDIYMYGGGLYSFFENYSTDCIPTLGCQKSMISLEKGNQRIWLFATSTIGTQNIAVSEPGAGGQEFVVQAGPNKSGFANNVALVLID